MKLIEALALLEEVGRESQAKVDEASHRAASFLCNWPVKVAAAAASGQHRCHLGSLIQEDGVISPSLLTSRSAADLIVKELDRHGIQYEIVTTNTNGAFQLFAVWSPK